MRAYLFLCELFLFWIIMLGFVLPWLYSQDDTILVGMGFVLTLATIPVCIWLLRHIWQDPKVQQLWKTLTGVKK